MVLYSFERWVNTVERIKGMVESVIYENPANGYTVCDISSDGKL